jgi:hypothetical protein
MKHCPNGNFRSIPDVIFSIFSFINLEQNRRFNTQYRYFMQNYDNSIFKKNRRKSAKIGENRRKSEKIGKNRRKLAKIAEYHDHDTA